MKHINIPVIVVLAVVTSLFGIQPAMARGGGFHGGGGGDFHGGGGGGWSGGRGGDFHGGGDFGGGGERPGRGGEFHGGGDHGWGDHGDHGNRGDRNNNNNSNNNNNTYNVNAYGNDDWGWGAADGALAGLAVGAAIGSAASQPSTVVVDNTTVVQQPPTFPAGTKVTVLPDGSQVRNVDGAPLYQSGSTWYKPYFGSNGVYYEVVPAPQS